ncbi:tRNA (adenosine(37)-N6)-threonylcarbamoyltransferase complex transferase subunit TsaD [Candidatus Wolfebacteria bacterium]|nr:tRNA (adenosine(37)-N6)-threonylcarbamoyltransferase complex transferase subunit TsaD [Candidatus Wolfebacteria bacterium]
MRILSIETSCDETAIALVEASGRLPAGRQGLKSPWPKFKILENLVASQIKIHRPFGGIVPNLAKREHLKNLPVLFKKLMASGYTLNPNLIAVTVGPGLEPALWTGINFAKELRGIMNNELIIKNKNKKTIIHNSRFIIPIIGASHLEGHLYSFLLNPNPYTLNPKNLFPAIALIVSGGHTVLLLMKNLADYKKLGETRDDAVGEAFDKVARLLDLPYPGGPEIEKLAKKGNPEAINFPRPMMNQKNYDFSFSGLKTAVLYYLKNQTEAKNFSAVSIAGERLKIRERVENLPGDPERRRQGGKFSSGASLDFDARRPTSEERFLADIAASFQQAAFDVLIVKALRAAREFGAKSIIVGGGVASSRTLKKYFRARIKKENPKLNLLIPPKKFCLDNAAMIGVSAYMNYLKKKNYRLKARANLPIDV